MTIEPANPFPHYSVTDLDDDPSVVSRLTVKTPEIDDSRKATIGFVNKYMTPEPASVIIAVRGDYGSGKTHLLLDAVSTAADEFDSLQVEPTVIRTPCVETDPVGWYRSGFGNGLTQTIIEKVMVELYADAGRRVARRENLTAEADVVLQSSPEKINALIRDSRINWSAVDEELRLILSDIGVDNQNIRSALASMVWTDSAETASRWILGANLTEAEQGVIGVDSALTKESDVADVITAIAAVHRHVHRPLVLAIDELEHLVRYDTWRGGKQNITWLKRVLESLGQHSTLVYVAGHWSAWEATADYLGRFTGTIDMRVLDGPDVLKIVDIRLSAQSASRSEAHFNAEVAEAIAVQSAGNMRRVFTTLSRLYEQTQRFTEEVTVDKLHEVVASLGRGLSLNEARTRITAMLEKHGLTVRRRQPVASGIEFDLTAFRGEAPRLAIALVQSINQMALAESASRFAQQLREVRKGTPGIVGFFIFEGAIEPELDRIFAAHENLDIYSVDLRNPDALIQIAEAVDRSIGPTATSDSELSKLVDERQRLLEQIERAQQDNDPILLQRLESEYSAIRSEMDELRLTLEEQNRRFQETLEKLGAMRSKEFESLETRLKSLSSSYSARDAGLIRPDIDEGGQRLHVAYQQISQYPSLWTRLRYCNLIIPALLVAVGIGIVLPALIGPAFYIPYLQRMLIGTGILIWAGVHIFKSVRALHYDEYSLKRLQRTSRWSVLMRTAISSKVWPLIGGALLGGGRFVEELFGGISSRHDLYANEVAIGTVVALSGVFFMLSQWMQLESFLEFRANTLRFAYLHEERPEDLILRDQRLWELLEHLGPAFAKHWPTDIAERLNTRL